MRNRNRNRNFRRTFGMGRGQMSMLQGVTQFGKPRFSRAQGDKPGSGPDGNCVCPECGKKVPHTTGVPCNETKCPECGAIMTRE